MSPARTAPLNVGKRLPELEERCAQATRVCAAHGFTPAVLDALVAGADLRDLLRGDTDRGASR